MTPPNDMPMFTRSKPNTVATEAPVAWMRAVQGHGPTCLIRLPSDPTCPEDPWDE